MLERAARWLGRGWVRQGRGGGGGPQDTRQPCPAWEGSSKAPQPVGTQKGEHRSSQSVTRAAWREHVCKHMGGWTDSINERAESHLPSAIWQFHYLELVQLI